MGAAEVSKTFINTLLIAMIISGAANTLVYKLQNISLVSYHGGPDVKFHHPFMQVNIFFGFTIQAISMFMGESLCFLLFLNARKSDGYKAQMIEAQAKGLSTKVNYFWLMLPAGADLITSTLQYIALNYISPSIYQMLRGGVIVVTALCSHFILKKPLQKYQIIGCGFAILGITLVGISNFPPFSSPSKQGASSTQQLVAMILILLSLFSNGVLFISEEWLFSKYFMHPFQVVGSEGLWGLTSYLLLLPILTFAPCPTSLASSCVNHNGSLHFERPDEYFYEIFHNGVLLLLVFIGIFTIAIFNMAGVSVTKYVSSVARSVVDVSRTVVVWLVGLIVTFTVPDAHWENTKWTAILIELVGFSILVFGNLIYNAIIVIPFLGGQKSIKFFNINTLVHDVSDAQVSLKQNSTIEEDF